MNHVGFRGGKQVGLDELEAHLGLAMRTENIGMLIGAGTSVAAGGPTMTSLWQMLGDAHPTTRDWLLSEGFADSPDANTPPNIEKAIDRLAIAEQDLRRRVPGTSEDLAEIEKHRSIVYQLLFDATLLDSKYWSGERDPATSEALGAHRILLARLISTRSPGQDAPWVFSTNYDLAVEWAAESLGLEVINGFGGLHDRRFSSSRFDLGFRNVQASGLARLGSYHLYLVKLHGSLTWLRVAPDVVREVSTAHAWRELSTIDNSRQGDSSRLSEILVILPNTQKYVATSGYIHGELIRKFTEFLGRPQTTLLVAGYSFNDEHLNRIVRSALNNPTLHLAVFLPELGLENDLYLHLSQTARNLVEPLFVSSSPRVTFVCGDSAYFERLAHILPEPALLDDTTAQDIRVERLLAQRRKNESATDDLD